MSPQNSDSLFDSADFDPVAGFDAGAAGDQAALLDQSQLRPVAPVQKQSYSVYTTMLIISLVALTTAAILFFIESSQY